MGYSLSWVPSVLTPSRIPEEIFSGEHEHMAHERCFAPATQDTDSGGGVDFMIQETVRANPAIFGVTCCSR